MTALFDSAAEAAGRAVLISPKGPGCRDTVRPSRSKAVESNAAQLNAVAHFPGANRS